MMQRTVEVEHPGNHEPTEKQLGAALDAQLRSEKIKRSGDFEIAGYTNVSGGPSSYTLKFAVAEQADKPAARGRQPKSAKPTEPKPAEPVVPVTPPEPEPVVPDVG